MRGAMYAERASAPAGPPKLRLRLTCMGTHLPRTGVRVLDANHVDQPALVEALTRGRRLAPLNSGSGYIARQVELPVVRAAHLSSAQQEVVRQESRGPLHHPTRGGAVVAALREEGKVLSCEEAAPEPPLAGRPVFPAHLLERQREHRRSCARRHVDAKIARPVELDGTHVHRVHYSTLACVLIRLTARMNRHCDKQSTRQVLRLRLALEVNPLRQFH
eukprot:3322759-Pleurochrysis_carterae.AAC.1